MKESPECEVNSPPGEMPGVALRNLVKELIPISSPEEGATSFVQGMDEFLDANGEFRELVYESCINYTVRRLITVGRYVRRECDALQQDEAYYIRKLRRQIGRVVGIADSTLRERFLATIDECVAASGRKISKSKREKVRRDAIESGKVCYICGRELDQGQPQDRAEVEHMWPRTLGGDNRDENLAVACERCNQLKQDHIDASDYHYERVSSAVLGPHDESFQKAFDTARRMAVWAKGNWRCAICGRKTQDYGPMDLERISEDDSWHFLNMQMVCQEHAQRGGIPNG